MSKERRLVLTSGFSEPYYIISVFPISTNLPFTTSFPSQTSWCLDAGRSPPKWLLHLTVHGPNQTRDEQKGSSGTRVARGG